MTTFALILSIIGAGTLTVGFMSLLAQMEGE